MNKIILLLLFATLQFQSYGQALPIWYKDHTTDIQKVNFSKLTNNHSDFSLVKVVDTVSIPEVTSIVVVNKDGKFLRQLNFDAAAYCSSKELIIAGRRSQGRLLLGVTDLKGIPVIPLDYLKIRYGKNSFALKNKESFWALYDSKGAKISEFSYTDMSFTPFGKIKIKNKKGTGILNEDGTVLIDNTYAEITQIKADSFSVKDPDTWEHLDQKKNIKFKWTADSISALNDLLYMVYAEDRVFIKDSLATIIGSENGYEKAEKISDHFIKVSLNDYAGLIDFSGNQVLPINYYDIRLDNSGYLKVLGDEIKALRFGDVVNKNKKRWSLYDSLGKKISSKQYKAIGDYNEGVVAVQTDENLWGFADEKGKIIIEPKYKYVSKSKNGLILVKLPKAGVNDYRLINRKEDLLYTGKEAQLFYLGITCYRDCKDSIRLEGEPETELYYGVPPYRYDSYTPAEYGYIRVKNGTFTGILNPKGKEAVQAYQDTVFLASADTFFLYKRNSGLVGYSDRYCNTTMTLNNKFEHVLPLQNGYSRFKKDGLYGFIDAQGNVQIAPKYTACGEFSNGMAAVFLQGKWGFVDKQENLKVQPYYKEVKPFRNGFAPVKNTKNKWIFIDKNGKPVNTTLYDDFKETKNGKYIVFKNKHWGLTDSKGKEILAPKYEYLE
ncbi:MAG TPA: WG repeat-containing protein, partial [Cytophagaceae bacterium]|nr:WG repeat-containing protein [Cytophagaceae bacterium]